MKNTLWKLLLKFGPKRTFARTGKPHLLIVSTTGLGDSLWGTPALKALRKQFPQGYIALLTSPIGEQLYRNNPNLDEIFVLKNRSLLSAFKLLPKLRMREFDTAYIFHTSQRPILPLVTLAGPSTIIGTQGINKGLDFLLTSSFPLSHQHEIERRLELVDAKGEDPKMELFLTEEENQASLSLLPDLPLVIGMHPGAKDKFKQWNPKYFIELGRKLVNEKGAKILVTGDPSEKVLADEIASHIPGATSLAGKLPVRVTAALIEKLDLYITNDTGPMHLSFAMGTPTFALFSPTDPTLCGPYQINHGMIIQKPKSCTPCIRKLCASPFCMEQISPQTVYEAIDAHLQA
ncbi:MAG: glycosyltransferase family 9 protein [Chlamydiales bacterium]|nr:glycosyltransferase family 9 protein [Chlamydiales bacterium]